MKLRTVLALLLISVMAFGVIGCEKIAEEAVEKAVEGATGIDVDGDKGEITIKGEDGEEIEIKAADGEDAEIPDDFPDDFPVYDAPVQTSTTMATDDGTSYTLILTSDDSFDDVLSWYKKELVAAGWTIAAQTETEVDGQKNAMFLLEEDEKTAGSVSIYEDEKEEITIALSVHTQ